MIKVLVAEDEKPLLRGIKMLVEEIDPHFTVVKCAVNGKEAIEYLSANRVDVVFTDINMLIVDGLELMKYLSAEHPETIVVVISGYNDFEYAQKAIRFGVKEYLLKPIVKEELAAILKRIEETFESSKLNLEMNWLQNAVYHVKQENIQEEKVQIAYACAGPFIKEGLEESIEECDFWKGADVERIASDMLPGDLHIYCFEKNQANERIMLLVMKNEINMQDFSRKFVAAMEAKNIPVTVAYNQARIGLKEISAVSRILRRCIQKNIIVGKGSFSCMQDDEKKKDTSNLSLSNFGITGKSAELALKQFDSFMKDGTVRQEECRKWLSTLLCYFMPEFKDEENNSQLEEMIANLFLYSANTSELSQNLRRMLDEKNIYKRENTTADIMEEMENYIKKHMTEAVTAAELAERFGLVAPYLSKLFKEYSGYTPPQYLQKIRLDQAKKLLESEQNYLAKDVAEMVGYPNPLYFSKVFKKNIGIYPSEYRKKYREGSGESK